MGVSEGPNVDYWLRYWLTYAASMLLERLFYSFLSFIPFYHVLRLAYIVWLFAPSTNGAQHVYGWGISPLLRRYRPTIDATISRVSAEIAHVTPSVVAREQQTGHAEGRSLNASLQEVMAQELMRAAASQAVAQVGKVASGILSAGGSSTEHRGSSDFQRSGSSSVEGPVTSNASSANLAARKRTASPAPVAQPMRAGALEAN